MKKTTLEAFSEYLQRDDGAFLRPKTAALYAGCIKKALECEAPQDPLFDEKLGRSRRETYQRALKHWAAFTDDQELLAFVNDWKPTRKDRKQKRKKGTPRALELDTEWVALRAAIDQLEDVPMRAVLSLLATSGLRVAEVLALTGKKLRVALKIGSALISSKGDVERYFILAEGPQRGHVEAVALRLKDSEALITLLYTKRRQSAKGVEAAIKTALVECARSAAIESPEELHPHMLRRTVGDAVYRATGGDLRAVQEALGHKNWRTTVAHYQDHAHLSETTAAFNKALKGGD